MARVVETVNEKRDRENKGLNKQMRTCHVAY